jgi:hypothetical protein
MPAIESKSERGPLLRSSRPPSVFSAASIDTLVADQSYRGYPSQQAYLEALREWVDSKMYYESEIQLKGFYGTKTSEYYKNKPGLRSEKKARRTPVAHLGTVADESESNPAVEETKGSKLKKVFSRRKTVA